MRTTIENQLQRVEPALKSLYGLSEKEYAQNTARFSGLVEKYTDAFGDDDLHFFSTPGRTEIGGNHTDHNHGRVIAASINLDSIAVASPNNTNQVILHSEGFPVDFAIDLTELNAINSEKYTTNALIRGIASRLNALGWKIGGFNAYVASEVFPGSGLSSSASIEVLIATIFSALFNENRVPVEELAKTGQFAENHYFGKPCGLMDQLACAIGGIVAIDFNDPGQPAIRKIKFDLHDHNFHVLIVNTGGNHVDLTDEYAAIPTEMRSVARAIGGEVCRDIDFDQLLQKITVLRQENGDRAVLRASHFLGENERVMRQINSLESGDFQTFLQLIMESGNSSFRWLQNIYSVKNVREQGIALALSLTEQFMQKLQTGACRVHGGGFAGTIQVFLPLVEVKNYTKIMETVFGKGSVIILNVRPYGTLYLNTFPGNWTTH